MAMDKYTVEIESYSDLLNKWNKRLREGQFSHYQAERYYKKYHYFFGVPAMILGIISGSAIYLYGVFLDVNALGVIVGISSFLSSLLIAIQTFVKFSELAEKHLSAAVKYGVLRREVERIKALTVSGDDASDIKSQVLYLKDQIDDIASGSLNISRRIWKKSIKIMNEEARR